MLSVKRIEFRIVRGAVLRSEPPAPIASLRGKERFECYFQRSFGRRAGSAFFVRDLCPSVSLARVPKQFPCRHVLGMADPDVKVCVNPGRRKNSGARRNVARCGDGFAGSERPDILICLHAAVEFAQKLAPVPRKILPGIFAIEKNANRQRLGRLHPLAKIPKLAVKVRSCVFSAHPAVDEADEVREMMVAKKSGHWLATELHVKRLIEPVGICRQSFRVAEETGV